MNVPLEYITYWHIWLSVPVVAYQLRLWSWV